MNTRFSRVAYTMVLAGSVMLVGCGGGDQDAIDVDTTGTGMGEMDGMNGMDQMEQTAMARLSPTEGNDVSGTVTFTSQNGSVRVEADIEQLVPGSHGFHVHETGDCSAPDASSAGGHFNPTGAQHGSPTDAERHVGDLGNIEAGSDSTASYSQTDSVITLTGANSIVGKAVVVHAGEDDLTSQPSGDAGARLACGVIESQSQGGGMQRAPGMQDQPDPEM